ncbi:MAG TPA: beta-ketoacyl-ACP reductase [Desulfotomaculum sp.]|nr:beta-ketoacyl-ACP reductase [Desulfotomaculum sp.]
MTVKDRVGLITGSGSGIGEGVAKKMAQNGAKVVVVDIDSSKVGRVVGEIKAEGGEAIGIASDITKKAEVDAMFKQVIDTFGGIDILVNNAGIGRDKSILKMSEEDWDSVLDVNLKGMFLCCQAAISHMREKKYGRIVNISSRAWLGWAGQANYSASKGGVVSLTRTLALELGRHGITVNCIAPGIIKTALWDSVPEQARERLLKIQPTGVIGTPNDIARTIMFFAGDQAGYITGQTIFVCGGKSLFASL